jgi:hypothetical protein
MAELNKLIEIIKTQDLDIETFKKTIERIENAHLGACAENDKINDNWSDEKETFIGIMGDLEDQNKAYKETVVKLEVANKFLQNIAEEQTKKINKLLERDKKRIEEIDKAYDNVLLVQTDRDFWEQKSKENKLNE